MEIVICMTRLTSRKGFYTLEAAVILPFVILAVLSVGYFIRLDSVWENVMHSAIDESSYSASRAYGSASELDSILRIRKRVIKENEYLDSLKIRNVADNYSEAMNRKTLCGYFRSRERNITASPAHTLRRQ